MQFEDKHYREGRGCKACKKAKETKAGAPFMIGCVFCDMRQGIARKENQRRKEREEKKRKWVNEVETAEENFCYYEHCPDEDTVHKFLIHTLSHLKKARKFEEEYDATGDEIKYEYGSIHKDALKYLEIIEDIVQLSKPLYEDSSMNSKI